MADIIFSCKSYAKIMMHAAKYPHCALNGILLAESDRNKEGSKNQKITIIDSIPLFHQCLNVTPMAEIALSQIDGLCSAAGLRVVGYYAASDNFSCNTLDKAPASRIADKIAELFPGALFALVDNRKMALRPESSALRVAQFHDGKWKMKDASHVLMDDGTLECVSYFLMGSEFKTLVDFDNHLDDPTQDWTNRQLNTLIENFMTQ